MEWRAQALQHLGVTERAMSSSEIYQKQLAKDIQHHADRIKWLEGPDPRWACGTKVCMHDKINLLRVSKEVMEKPWLGYNSAQ